MTSGPSKAPGPAPAAPSGGVRIWSETVEVPIADLKPAPWNPNVQDDETYRHQVESIRRFGFVGPIVVRGEDRLIIGGHHRIRALQELRDQATGPDIVDVVPCTLVWGLSDEEAKALSLALNRIHGEFEPEALESLVRELAAGEEDWASVGICGSEVEELLGEDAALEAASDIEIEVPDDTGGTSTMMFDVPLHLTQFVEEAIRRARRHRDVGSDGDALVLVCQRALRRKGNAAL